MSMTPFIKSLLTAIFNIAVVVVLAYILFFIVVWAAALFAVPAGLVQLFGFLIFIYAAYRVVMLIIGFIEANPIKLQ